MESIVERNVDLTASKVSTDRRKGRSKDERMLTMARPEKFSAFDSQKV